MFMRVYGMLVLVVFLHSKLKKLKDRLWHKYVHCHSEHSKDDENENSFKQYKSKL